MCIIYRFGFVQIAEQYEKISVVYPIQTTFFPVFKSYEETVVFLIYGHCFHNGILGAEIQGISPDHILAEHHLFFAAFIFRKRSRIVGMALNCFPSVGGQLVIFFKACFIGG